MHTIPVLASVHSAPEDHDTTTEDVLDDDEDSDPADDICPACNGSGEGMYDGTSCGTCHPRRGSRNNRHCFDSDD